MSDCNHSLFFIPHNATSRSAWVRKEPPRTLSCDGDNCTMELPAAPDRGSWKIECEHCPAWALVTVEHSVGDPRTFTMPCGRIKMNSEKEQDC
jgi:hypothetical protein